MQAVALFMAAKLAPSFILATELKEPDCVCAVGISHAEVVMCTAHIRRRPRPWSAANFSQVEWWPQSSIGSEVLDLLPKGARTITEKDVRSLDAWFGVNGKFPATHIASGASSNI